MKIEMYETSDIYLAAYLKISGIHYIGTRNIKSKTFLQFQNSDVVRDLIHRYNDDTSRVSPKALRDAVRVLKTIISQEKNSPEAI